MNKQFFKGSAMMGPLPPTMVSCGSGGRRNIITVAWTGIICTRPPRTYISVRPERYSHDIIKEEKEFAINLVPSSLVRQCDYCGTYTGSKVDKFKECGLTEGKCEVISCPSVAECPITLECRVFDMIPLGSHDMFLADIVGVDVAEDLIDGKGKIHFERAGLTGYMHGVYFSLGKTIAPIGVSTKRKSR